MLSLTEALRHAGALYRAGEWTGAEELCTSILKVDPAQLEAIELLGVIAARSRRMPQALDMLGRLVAARPDDPTAHSNYANVLKQSCKCAAVAWALQ
jgi:predicted Zn-dependent protease